jgi:hypothetical protein
MSGKTIVVLVALLPACGTVHFDVPEGRRVKLLARDAKTTVRVERVVWFAGWGAEPLSENHTAPFIAEHGLVEVRLYNEQSLWDTLINMIAGVFSFSRRTMIIEGNPAPETTP